MSDFEILEEPWTTIELEPGLKARVRATLVFARLQDAKGELRVAQQAVVVADDSHRGPGVKAPTQVRKRFQPGSPIEKSTYKLPNGKKVELQLEVGEVALTDGFDEHGDPILNLQFGLGVKQS